MDTLLPLEQFSFAGGVTPDRLRGFLVHCYRHGVSDIHLQSGGPLIVGHHGRMIRCSPFTLDHPTLLYLTDQIFSPDIKALIQRGTGADRSLQLEGNSDGRFGLQRGGRTTAFPGQFYPGHHQGTQYGCGSHPAYHQ